MRRAPLFWAVLLVCFVTFGLHTFATQIALLFETGARDLVTKEELDYGYGNHSAGTLFEGGREQLIPKIIHQTYKNKSIPAVWTEPVAKCKALHPDYKYMFWSDDSAREFISQHYPLFLPTFDGYPYPIERADVIRYFVLHHYGGTYLDMDLGCERSLDVMNQYPFWAHLTNPTGISNDAMGSIPKHAFLGEAVIPALPSHDFRYPVPYITVMASTGPLFLSAIWKRWIDSEKNVDQGRIRVILRDDFSGPGGLVTLFKGSSWHQDDVTLIMWLVSHWFAISVLVAVTAALASYTMWGCCCWRGASAARRRRRREGKSYALVDRHEV